MLLVQGWIFQLYMAFFVPVDCVMFAKYCGKTCSRYLFGTFNSRTETLADKTHIHRTTLTLTHSTYTYSTLSHTCTCKNTYT